MANILLTGIVTLDIINHLQNYPEEDCEARALAQDFRRGGNASNTATILSQLNHNCTLAANITDDGSGSFLLDDLHNNHIELPSDCQLSGYTTPTSYISLSQKSGSRTIIHYRNLPELSHHQFNQIQLDRFDWLHFESRNIHETRKIMDTASQYEKTISLELEKPRENSQSLIDFANIIFISRPYAESLHFKTATDCIQHFHSLYPEKIFICTWGASGANAINHEDLYSCPATTTENIIDTIGAGDTFIAGFIHAFLKLGTLEKSLIYATRLAGLKCTQNGLTNLEITDVY
ncbi:MAG: PfkB family carbohydrate kinase [Gammaproteobacteria bacterium]|nr:PfkB family carbohydrate kinase [Gammaproteobacteria bacterium]